MNVDSVHSHAIAGFQDGDGYEQSRPSYTEEVTDLIANIINVSTDGSNLSYDVLELGAGTGKFTKKILHKLQQDVRYLATEPMEGFLETLKKSCPSVETRISASDALSLPDNSVQTVVAAQCFHWFANDQSLREIHRVLVPGGNFVSVWNNKDISTSWVGELEDILTEYYSEDTPRAVAREWLKVTDKFTGFSTKQHTYLPGINFQGNRDFIIDHFCSISVIACLPDDQKMAFKKRISSVIEKTREIKDQDIINLPFKTEIFHVVKV